MDQWATSLAMHRGPWVSGPPVWLRTMSHLLFDSLEVQHSELGQEVDDVESVSRLVDNRVS